MQINNLFINHFMNIVQIFMLNKLHININLEIGLLQNLKSHYGIT